MAQELTMADDDVIHKQFHILNTIFSVLSLHAQRRFRARFLFNINRH